MNLVQPASVSRRVPVLAHESARGLVCTVLFVRRVKLRFTRTAFMYEGSRGVGARAAAGAELAAAAVGRGSAWRAKGPKCRWERQCVRTGNLGIRRFNFYI